MLGPEPIHSAFFAPKAVRAIGDMESPPWCVAFADIPLERPSDRYRSKAKDRQEETVPCCTAGRGIAYRGLRFDVYRVAAIQ